MEEVSPGAWLASCEADSAAAEERDGVWQNNKTK
jgi:hypothetical protein